MTVKDTGVAYRFALRLFGDQKSHLRALALKENGDMDLVFPDSHSVAILRRDTCLILQRLWGPGATATANSGAKLAF
jgi:hypothetical protein